MAVVEARPCSNLLCIPNKSALNRLCVCHSLHRLNTWSDLKRDLQHLVFVFACLFVFPRHVTRAGSGPLVSYWDEWQVSAGVGPSAPFQSLLLEVKRKMLYFTAVIPVCFNRIDSNRLDSTHEANQSREVSLGPQQDAQPTVCFVSQ